MDEQTLIAQQDSLRPLRTFVGALQGALAGWNDQTFAGQDGYAFNTPYRYQTVSPYGYAIEGAPISATPAGGLVISPVLVMLGLGAAAVLLWKR